MQIQGFAGLGQGEEGRVRDQELKDFGPYDSTTGLEPLSLPRNDSSDVAYSQGLSVQ
jgi:hypothetical protein